MILRSALGLVFCFSTIAPAAAQAQKWQGAYVGALAGVAWGDSTADFFAFNSGGLPALTAAAINTLNSSTSPVDLDPVGGSFGVQIGYNRQSGALVYGGVVDFASLQLDDSHRQDIPGGSSLTTTVSTDWLLTARGKIGWVRNDLLIFATAGLAVTDMEFTQNFVDGQTSALSNVSDTRVGWTVGAGAELLLGSNWSTGIEYLYADFGSVDSDAQVTNAVVGPINSFTTNEADLTTHLVRAQVSRRF